VTTTPVTTPTSEPVGPPTQPTSTPTATREPTPPSTTTGDAPVRLGDLGTLDLTGNKLRTNNATVRSGIVRLGTVTCAEDGAAKCRFKATGTVVAVGTKHRKKRALTAQKFVVSAGDGHGLSVRLSKADRKLLAKGKSLTVRLTLTVTGKDNTTVVVHRRIVIAPPQRG
jgi:hypothetical protein